MTTFEGKLLTMIVSIIFIRSYVFCGSIEGEPRSGGISEHSRIHSLRYMSIIYLGKRQNSGCMMEYILPQIDYRYDST